LAKALDASAKVASSALSGAVSSNLILSVVAGVSMKMLWTMISSLQIIVHYPMLKIPMPANLLKMLNAIVEIVNLGLLPKKYIKEFLGKFTNQTMSSTNSAFKSSGYESDNILMNLGMVIIILGIGGILVGLVFLL
jgi:hypothetical protein